MLKKYYAVFGPALRVLDAIILIFSWLVAYYLRKHYPLAIMTNAIPPLGEYWSYSIVLVLLWGLNFSLFNLYSSKRMTRRTVEAFQVLKAHTLSLLIFISMTYLISTYKLSRGVFVYFYFISGFLLAYSRILLRNALRYLRIQGYNVQRVLIVGSGTAALQSFYKLKRHPELGLDFIGFVSPQISGEKTEELKKAGLPYLGSLDQLSSSIQKNQIQKLIVALSSKESESLGSILSEFKDQILDIVLVPDIYEYIALGCEVEEFDGLPMVSLNETPIVGLNLFLKRVIDIVFAFLALVIFSPLLIVVSVLIKLTSSGPVFFRQERMSLNGKPFSMLKFRSMRIDQKGDVELLTKANDPRVTAIGNFIRKTSLDELPQFFNVLVGHMSIVGPRPERTWVVEEVRTKIPRYMLKHKVKAGITGWAQVNGWRGDTSLEKRIEYDLFYIRNWSILSDLKILFLTVFKGFMNRNAY